MMLIDVWTAAARHQIAVFSPTKALTR